MAIAGHRKLSPRQQVKLEWEVADQDGFSFRATRVWQSDYLPIDETTPAAGEAGTCGGAYGSRLTIRFDG